ncbi:hypothetical protein AKO1_014655 [Acrasis kona]|uniref:Inositol phosphatase domain-containing protein n=1 Tax=Acrasis kona TaxID=1008807 RepID=A0AAW2Z3U8_9EUKA
MKVQAFRDDLDQITASKSRGFALSYMSSMHPEIQYVAFQAFENFQNLKWANQQEECEAFVTRIQAAIPPHRICRWLTTLCKDESNPQLVLTLLGALKQLLVKEKVDVKDLADFCLASPMLRIMNQSLYNTSEICSSLLEELVESSEFGSSIVNLGGMLLLHEWLQKSEQQPKWLRSTLKIIAKLTNNNRNAQLVAGECGILFTLCRLMVECKDPIILQKCVRTFRNLTQNEINVQSLVGDAELCKKVILNCLLPLCSDASSIKLVEDVSITISNMTLSSDVVCSFIAPHCADPLVHLLSLQNEMIQEYAMSTISNVLLCSSTESFSHLENVKTKLLQLTITRHDEHIQQQANQLIQQIQDPSKTTNHSGPVKTQEYDFELKKQQIEQAYIKQTERNLTNHRASVRNSLSPNARIAHSSFDSLQVVIDWSTFDALTNTDTKRRALSSIRNQEAWDDLRSIINEYCNKSLIHHMAFNNIVKKVVVKLDKEFKVIIHDSELDYHIAHDSIFRSSMLESFTKELDDHFKPVMDQLEMQMQNLDGTDTNRTDSPTTPNTPSNSRTTATQQLKKYASDCAADWDRFVQFVQIKPFHVNDPQDVNAIAHILHLLKLFPETFVKGWRLTKYNKEGLKQERYLMLTRYCYYTVKYDAAKKSFDPKHTKRCSLEIKSIEMGTFHDGSKPVLCITVPNVSATLNATSATTTRSHSTVMSATSPDGMKGGAIYPKSNSLVHVPNNGGTCLASMFVWENENDAKKAENVLFEIAICMHGVACALAVEKNLNCMPRIHHKQRFSKPKHNISSFLYNRFKMGYTK